MKNKTYTDISVVVQGPVQSLGSRGQEQGITNKCLNSVRNYLPGAKIILSTWHNQNLDGLDYDELVLCEDPGQNIRKYNKDGSPKYYNNNRQIVSTLEGLKRVKTKYAIKLRSDNYLTSNNFISLQTQFPARSNKYRFLKERVVTANAFTRKYAKGQKVAFHLSDFFYFGLTDDLLTLWDLPLVKDYKKKSEHDLSPSHPNYITDCTQLFWLRSLQKFEPSITLEHLLDNNKEKTKQSDICYANNVIISSPEEIGLNLGEKFSNGKVRISRERGKCAHIYFHEWQDLYKKYCDPTFNIEPAYILRFKLFINRLKYIFPVYFEAKIRQLKRKKYNVP
ncbi:WavE lipopolysaccharide synthesis family protein [Psychromonas arctica]|uniref:WavE lipopolysaccharide synthesis family protein n=1 Tax=Psychromonas arctica TaxID=168275 RepID=UPI0003FC9B65|nr:WavE lipopolysaccharide synthesis family protein [Psychromonas arctica]